MYFVKFLVVDIMIFKSHDEAIDFFAELNGKLDLNCINTLKVPNDVLINHKALVEEAIEAYYDYMLSVYNNLDLQEDIGKIYTVLGQIEALAKMLSVLKVKVSMARVDAILQEHDENSVFDGSYDKSMVSVLEYNFEYIHEQINIMRNGGMDSIKYVLELIEKEFNEFMDEYPSLFDEYCLFAFVEIAHEWAVEAKASYEHMIQNIRMHYEAFGVFHKYDIKVEWDDSPFEFDRNLPQEYNSCWDWSYIDVQVVNDESVPDTMLLTYTPLIEPVLLIGAGENVVASCVFRPVEATLNNILLFGGFAEGVEAIQPIV